MLKKLVLILANLVLIISDTKKVLKQIIYIHYLILFDNIKVYALLDLRSEINIMTLVFIDKLDFYVQKIDIKAQKIDRLTLKMFRIVIEVFYSRIILKRFDFSKKCFC